MFCYFLFYIVRGGQMMIVEIITTGTELLLGQILNTNSQYLSQKLNDLGFNVLFHSTVGDNKNRMAQVFSTALGRADIIITSGGLGPTQGDITKEVSAALLNRPLELDDASLDKIRDFFVSRNRSMPDNNLRQAMIPKGAIIVPNDCGTAPGIIIEDGSKTIIHLPGPPKELQCMLDNHISAYLTTRFGIQGVIVSRVLHTIGIGESSLEEQIKDLILNQSNPTIALLARKGEVVVRLTARATSMSEANSLVCELEQKINERIAPHIWGVDNDTLEEIVGTMLMKHGLTLSLAESCTGGLVTHRITDISGSSSYLIGSIVCYSNDIKNQHLEVPANTLKVTGAVSQETAEYMATGIKRKFNTSVGIGITGIAGPLGATPSKPVGTVYIAIDGPNGICCQGYHLHGQRTDIKYQTSQITLNMLREYLNKINF